MSTGMNGVTCSIAAVVVSMLALAVAGHAQTARGDAPEDWPEPVLDSEVYRFVLVDRLEYRGGGRAVSWDGLSWIGGDYNRLWIETEGDAATDGSGGEVERLDVEYGRLIAPFWDFQAGIGYQRSWSDGPDVGRFFAVVGLQGLAPQWFEVDANLRISEDGDVSADLEAEYDVLVTQRLVLQPRFETAVAVQEVEEFGVGQGFNSVQLGVRLRYEVRRELAPYIGISWMQQFGGTADLSRTADEDTEELALVGGIRFWF